ncbi:MAG: hypothetical protein K2N44_17555 [Lachnospiraceae bacterium]|nr:hypothetical protein [Lachnospiraceae bacterium]
MILKKYWTDTQTNLFKNYFDAIFGMVVLVCLPLCSLIMVNVSDEIGFWNYVFPLTSIGLAGAYDAYGRYERGAPRNFKLGIRVFFDFLAIFFAAYFANIDRSGIHYIPSIILLFSGCILLGEAFNRIKTAVEISPWYAKFK